MSIQDFIHNFLDLSITEKGILLFIILIVSLLLALIFRTKWVVVVLGLVAIQVALIFFLKFTGGYMFSVHLYYFVPSIILSFFIYALLPQKKTSVMKGKVSPWKVIIPVRKGSAIIIENIKRGLVIFGSGGAGKTESVFIPLISRAANCNITGINYDYKDGELTEIVNYFQFVRLFLSPMSSDSITGIHSR